MEPRLRTSRSPASPRPCPIPGVSRSGASDCDVSPATHARRHRSRRRNRLKQTPNQRQPSRSRNALLCRPKSLPKLWTSCRRPPDSPRVPCEPVSVCNRTGLRPAEREIEKWRPETGAQNPPRTDRNTENYRPQTGIRQRNPRECRRFSPTDAAGDATERAYRRGDALEKRRGLMEAWANFCEPKAGSNVLSMTRPQAS